MRPNFQLTCDPPVACLRAHGELDIGTGADMAVAFASVTRHGCVVVEVDLDGVTFIDAYTLSRLHREQVRLRRAGGDLVVVAASSWCRLVCRLARYESLLPVSDVPPRLRPPDPRPLRSAPRSTAS